MLGERPEAAHERAPEHLITWPEHPDALADRFDPPRHIAAQNPILRLAQPELQAGDVRVAPQDVPVGGVDGGRMNAQKHPVASGLGLAQVLKF